MSLVAQRLRYSYDGRTEVLRGVSLKVVPGTVHFLLGPNGSGKTTLLECLGGLRWPRAGEVLLEGRGLPEIPQRERARAIGYVPQLHRPVFGYRVLEVVLMGRAPYLGPLSGPSPNDVRIAMGALEAVGLSGFAERPYTELSGGELRLVLIARALAQGAKYLLLDEPDAHLDPANQLRVLDLVRGIVVRGLGVLITSHNPDTALRYAQWVTLLRQGEVTVQGRPPEVLIPSELRRAYGVDYALLEDGSGRRALVPLREAQGNSERRASTPRERSVSKA